MYMVKNKRQIAQQQVVVSRLKTVEPTHFLRAWRKHRDKTLEEAAAFVGEATGEGFTHASLSRMERGLQPYSQPVLEALADYYHTDPASLLMRNPLDPDAIWTIWEKAKPGQRVTIREVASTIVKTGT